MTKVPGHSSKLTRSGTFVRGLLSDLQGGGVERYSRPLHCLMFLAVVHTEEIIT
jgi:hypothetical protein